MNAGSKWVGSRVGVIVWVGLLAGGWVLAGDGVSRGDGSPANPYVVPATDAHFKIDGQLDEAAWKDALSLDLKYETSPGENIQPPVRTEVLLIYGTQELYVGFRCHDDDPSAIRARLTDREDFFGDDHVNIHIDTFNDERRHFTLGANPLGVQMDAVADGNRFDWSWDAIFESAGRIQDWGYSVELAIPFRQLRFQRSEGAQIWGFDAWRVYPRSTEHFIGVVPSDRNNNCRPCQMLKIRGFEGVAPGKNVELVPTVTAVRTDQRPDLPDGAFERANQDLEAGLTGRWGMTPNLTLSATINPDFSQVEADARQMDINQPFALHYQEKRPFFQEGKDFFKSPLGEAIYTRTLRDPVWGVNVSGKEGANTVAAFVVQDNVTNLLFPASQYSDSLSMPQSSYASVFRYKRDLGNRYTLGALVTDRESEGYFNRLYGFDGDLRLTDKDRVAVQFLGSSTRYPNDIAAEKAQPLGTFSDGAFEATYEHNTRSIFWSAGARDYGSDFRADLGFVPQVGYRDYRGEVGYQWRPEETSWYSRLLISGSHRYDEDARGNLLQRRSDAFAIYQGPLQTVAATRIFTSRQVYNGAEFNLFWFGTYTGITPNEHFGLGLDTSFGDKIDYYNTRLGQRVRLAPEIHLSLGDRFRLGLNHEYERLNVHTARLYTANITQVTAVYQFNLRTFVRSIVQYVDYRYNPELYAVPVDPEFRQLFMQYLFSYKVNPRTVLFIGYSDNHYATSQYGLAQADRSFFAKIGYAWQF